MVEENSGILMAIVCFTSVGGIELSMTTRASNPRVRKCFRLLLSSKKKVSKEGKALNVSYHALTWKVDRVSIIFFLFMLKFQAFCIYSFDINFLSFVCLFFVLFCFFAKHHARCWEHKEE